jgi:hypothetical protein
MVMTRFCNETANNCVEDLDSSHGVEDTQSKNCYAKS